MAINGPGNRLPTGQQAQRGQAGFKGTAVGNVGGGMTKIPAGTGRTNVPSQRTTRTAPPRTTPPAADPFAGKSYNEVLGMYRGSTDARFRRQASSALQRLGRPAVTPPTQGPGTTTIGQGTPTEGTGAGTPTEGAGAPISTYTPTSVQPTSVEDYLSGLGGMTPEQAPSSQLIDPEIWKQILGNLQAPLPELPTTNLPTQEALGQLFQQKYEQQLADLGVGVEERQQREQARLAQDLINRGISPDSEAFASAQRGIAEARATEAAQMRQQARAFAEQGVQNEYNRALAASQEQRAAFETAQGARYKGIEALSPLVQAQAQLEQNRWATKYNADVQRQLTSMNLASDEKKFFANLGQQDRQFFETIIREDRRFAADQTQWDKTFKESVRQFNENQKVTNKKLEADIKNDRNLTKIQQDQLIELVRSNKAQEALEARKIAAMNAGNNKDVDQIAAEQKALIDGKIKGYQNAIYELTKDKDRADELTLQVFGKGIGGVSYSQG